METTKRPTQLAIDGKVISIEKIGEKSLAQFKAQLKQNGLQIEDERAKRVYDACYGGKSNEEIAAMIKEAEEAAKQKTNN